MRESKARVWWSFAVEPDHASQMNAYFGADPSGPTIAEVEAEFGEAAADAWRDARLARRKFFDAVGNASEDIEVHGVTRRIIWHGPAATGADLAMVERELQELLDDGLAHPADLVFHHVWFDDGDPEGRTVLCWGKRRSPCFHAEIIDE